MKFCHKCSRVVLDRVETCPECGCEDFTDLLIAPDIGPYEEDDN